MACVLLHFVSMTIDASSDLEFINRSYNNYNSFCITYLHLNLSKKYHGTLLLAYELRSHPEPLFLSFRAAVSQLSASPAVQIAHLPAAFSHLLLLKTLPTQHKDSDILIEVLDSINLSRYRSRVYQICYTVYNTIDPSYGHYYHHFETC